jgi:NAD(P)-dependent dehydrogenase (short-subunit alcohol dehydrogenase family)
MGQDETIGAGAVVVGGGSGIGAAVARRHRDGGSAVVVWDLDGERDITCDLQEPDQVQRAVEETIERVGVPDRVTVTAGVGHGALLLDAELADFDRVISVNVRGVWLTLREFARVLVDGGQAASMVAVSSVSAHVPDRTMGLYCASKAALDMVVKVAAAEWATHGIRVNAVAPGVTETPMLGPAPRDRGWLAHVAQRTALGRLGRADEIADAILALHGLGWVTGQVLDCDGGLTLHSPIDPYGELGHHS